MRKTIESVLKVKPSTPSEIDKQHTVTEHANINQRYNVDTQQNFRYGRNTGRRLSDQRNLHRENSPRHYQTTYHSQYVNNPRVTVPNSWSIPRAANYNNLVYPEDRNTAYLPVPVNKYM